MDFYEWLNESQARVKAMARQWGAGNAPNYVDAEELGKQMTQAQSVKTPKHQPSSPDPFQELVDFINQSASNQITNKDVAIEFNRFSRMLLFDVIKYQTEPTSDKARKMLFMRLGTTPSLSEDSPTNLVIRALWDNPSFVDLFFEYFQYYYSKNHKNG